MSSWQMFFWGGGKCPNWGVVNVRILGVVNVRLANNLTPAHTGCTAASEASDQHLCVGFTPPVSSNLLCTLYTWPLLSETKIDPIATCVFVTSLLLCHSLHKVGDSSLNQMIFNIICPSTSPQLTDQPLE